MSDLVNSVVILLYIVKDLNCFTGNHINIRKVIETVMDCGEKNEGMKRSLYDRVACY